MMVMGKGEREFLARQGWCLLTAYRQMVLERDALLAKQVQLERDLRDAKQVQSQMVLEWDGLL